MSDGRWVSAIAQYDNDDFHARKSFLMGGSHQLSSVLEAKAKEDPARFAKLASALPDDAEVAYYDAILRGVTDAQTTIPLDELEALILRCHALPGRPCGRWIARPLKHYVDTPLSDAMVEIINWYATADADPEADRAEEEGRGADERLRQHGLNSVRGGIAYEAARLIWNNPANLDRLAPTLRSLVSDPVGAVRAMAAETVIGVLTIASDRALDLFDQLVTGARDDLLATRHVFEFLRYRISVDYDRLRVHAQRMLASPDAGTQEHGAALVCIAALSVDAARPLADACLTGTTAQRLGAAKVYAANLTTAHHRERCEATLRELFNDLDKDVRDAAADVVRRFSGTELGDYPGLVEALAASQAAADNWDDILYALTETTSPVPDLTLAICSQLLEGSPDAVSTIRDVAAHRADSVSELLVRVYSDGDDAAKSRALDLIDLSLEHDVYGVLKALGDYERPWLSGA
jgi:hypothetical protein